MKITNQKIFGKHNSQKLLPLTIIAILLLSMTLIHPGFAATPNSSTSNGWQNIQLTATDAVSRLPAVISYDGSKIAYSEKVGDPGGSDFFVLDTNTGLQTQLTSLAAGDFDPYRPSISANGSKIAFQSVDYGQSGSVIVLINSDGSGKTVLTDRAQYVAFSPSISGDGSKIAFEALMQYRGEIYIINVKDGTKTSLTPPTGSYTDLAICRSPSISGDGSKVVFYSENPDGTADVYIINSDGTSSTPTKIFSNLMPVMPGDFYPPSISQDGTKVVFYSKVDGLPQVFIWNASTGVTTKLTQETANSAPQISGDGSKIVFTSNRDNLASPYTSQIYIMNNDGTSQTRVSNDVLSICYAPTTNHDGTKIASYASPNAHNYQIWMSALAATSRPNPLNLELNSLTLDPEDSTGQTNNAPGAWSTNTGDPLSQVGVKSNGYFLNQGSDSATLGDISIPLQAGLNTFNLVGNGVHPNNPFYGAVLFFNGVASPPQIAVYNQNGATSAFMVQPNGKDIIGSANGGLFFDKAPGTSTFTTTDGTKIEVVNFTINSQTSTTDQISYGNIGADGTNDTTATLILRVTPNPLHLSLTSLTIDPEDSTGQTNNAPGAWSTNLGDPFTQMGLKSTDGFFLNQQTPGISLGEINVPLQAGLNTFNLVGNGIYPTNAFYGAILFFNGVPTPPPVAVYNQNGATGAFSVQAQGTNIMSNANGGNGFDPAPGTNRYIAADGTVVEVVSFILNSLTSSSDEVSAYNIGANGQMDTTGTLILRVTPNPLHLSLTSLTIDPEGFTGQTTNAPGAWSTNLGDPLTQMGVKSTDGFYLNQQIQGISLGEISIPLQAGLNTFNLVGNGLFPSNGFYGAVLFFNGVPTPPQAAVYNQNGATGSFLVQAQGTQIMSNANGGHGYDPAPGTNRYVTADGTVVEVVSFTLNSLTSSSDEVSAYNIGANGQMDTTGTLILRVTPNLTLKSVTSWNWASNTVINSVASGDVDKDGNSEIVSAGNYYDGTREVAQLIVWNGANMAVKQLTIWYWNDNTSINSVAVGDVNGDGQTEIVTGGSYYDGARDVAQLVVWDGSSLAAEKIMTWYWTGNTIIKSVALGDVDGDGHMEIVTGGYYNDGARNIAQLAIWNGSSLASESVKTWYWTGNTVINSVALGDVDSDNQIEIVTGGSYFDGSRNNAQLIEWSGSSLAVDKIASWFWTGDTVINSVAIANVDGNGQTEIVTGGSYFDGTRTIAQLVVWNGANLAVDRLTGWYWTGNTMINSVGIGDVDGDGQVEIVTGGQFNDGIRDNAQMIVWSGSTLAVENIQSWFWTSNTAINSVAVGDVNNDFSSEIVTGGAFNDGSRSNSQLTVWGMI